MVRRSHTAGRSTNWYNHFGKIPGIYYTEAMQITPCNPVIHSLIYTVGLHQRRFCLPLRGHWAIPGDPLDCHNLGDATGT